jgi:hypothetical protein
MTTTDKNFPEIIRSMSGGAVSYYAGARKAWMRAIAMVEIERRIRAGMVDDLPHDAAPVIAARARLGMV